MGGAFLVLEGSKGRQKDFLGRLGAPRLLGFFLVLILLYSAASDSETPSFWKLSLPSIPVTFPCSPAIPAQSPLALLSLYLSTFPGQPHRPHGPHSAQISPFLQSRPTSHQASDPFTHPRTHSHPGLIIFLSNLFFFMRFPTDDTCVTNAVNLKITLDPQTQVLTMD